MYALRHQISIHKVTNGDITKYNFQIIPLPSVSAISKDSDRGSTGGVAATQGCLDSGVTFVDAVWATDLFERFPLLPLPFEPEVAATARANCLRRCPANRAALAAYGLWLGVIQQ